MMVSLSFVSCVSENEEYVPEKPEEYVNVYYGFLSGPCLDYLDVTLTLHSGNKTKTVVLKKEDGKKDVSSSYAFPGSNPVNTTEVYGYLFAGFDGAESITKVEANVVLKADALDKLAKADSETSIPFCAGVKVTQQTPRKDGKYEYPDNLSNGIYRSSRPAEFLAPAAIGGVNYDHLIESVPSSIKAALEVK